MLLGPILYAGGKNIASVGKMEPMKLVQQKQRKQAPLLQPIISPERRQEDTCCYSEIDLCPLPSSSLYSSKPESAGSFGILLSRLCRQELDPNAGLKLRGGKLKQFYLT